MEVRTTQGPVSLAQPRAPKVACQNLVTQEAPGGISIRIGCNGCSLLFEVGRAAQQWRQQVAEPSFGAILRYCWGKGSYFPRMDLDNVVIVILIYI